MTIRPVEASFPLRTDGWTDRHKNGHDEADKTLFAIWRTRLKTTCE